MSVSVCTVVLCLAAAPEPVAAERMAQALAAGDFDRALLWARLTRNPKAQCEVLLAKAAALHTHDRAAARAAVESALRVVQRYGARPATRQQLAPAARQAERQLAILTAEDALRQGGAADVQAAVTTLLPLLDAAEARARWCISAAQALDVAGRRDLAQDYFRLAVEQGGETLPAAAARVAGRLLAGRGDGVSIAAVDALLTRLIASPDAADDPLAAYIVALLVEFAGPVESPVLAEAAARWAETWANSSPVRGVTAWPRRLAVHAVPLARRRRQTVNDRVAAVAEAHGWLAGRGHMRDAADAAIVAASLAASDAERNRWRDLAAAGYQQLASLDAAASRAGLARVAALAPPNTATLARQFEAGRARPDFMIEDRAGFARRVRASYEVSVGQAFEQGAFDEAFRRAQQAKLAEIGHRLPWDRTLDAAGLSRLYVLDPERLEGPTVDLVIEFLVAADATYVFGLRADAKRQRFDSVARKIPLGRAAFAAQVAALLGALDGDTRPARRELFDRLLGDVWREWPGPWVVISPDGPLRLVPFGLLVPPDGPMVLHRVTQPREAVQAHGRARSALLAKPTRRQQNVLEARRMGLWPEAPGRLSLLPTVAVLHGANESLATRENVLALWSASAARLDVAPGVRAPRLANPPGNGAVLALWDVPGHDDTPSLSSEYVQAVFSLASPDYGRNMHGRILAQLQRDLVEGYRVRKNGRDASLVALERPASMRDWARWVFVDLAPVRRPR